VAIVFWVRVLRPWRLLHRPWRIVDVKPDRAECWTVSAEPVGHSGFTWEPGQFAWLTVDRSPFIMHEHPFSIASTPDPTGRVEFVIKELGDFTRTIGQIPPGTLAYVDGPYGSFSIDRYPEAAGYVFMSGGIGVAPMLSMLRALAQRGDERSHLIFTGHSTWDRVPAREELARLEGEMNLKVIHVLEDPPEDWGGRRGGSPGRCWTATCHRTEASTTTSSAVRSP
jgi:predicted ferric reductase